MFENKDRMSQTKASKVSGLLLTTQSVIFERHVSTIFKRNVNHYRWEIQKKTSCSLGLEHGAIFVFISLVTLQSDVNRLL